MIPPRNVLIFHAGALGDFVLTWPLAVALGRLHPQSRIFYVTQSQKGKLAERVLGIDAVDSEIGWHSLFGDAKGLPERSIKLLEGSHSIYSFIAKDGDGWTANVRRLAPRATVTSLDTRAPAAGLHISEQILAQLASLPAAHAAMTQILRSINTRGLAGWRGASSNEVVVHPGSGAREKCWPVDRFVELIKTLRDRGDNVRVLLGEVELERWGGAVIEKLTEAATSVARPSTYVELLDHLSAAKAFIGNDSGPGHLAGIIGMPTVSIFGPSDPAVWKPLGPRVKVIRGEPIGSIEVAEILRAVSG